jgi:acetyl esterase/lipase
VSKRLVMVILLFTVTLLLFPPLHRSYEALQFLLKISGADATSLTSTAQVQRKQIEFTDRDHTIKADLYLGETPARAAIVLQHGAAHEGKNDARLVTLARQLAQARFVVLVPEMLSARALQVSSDEIPVLQRAVDYLHRERDGLFQGPIGIGGFSVAAGLAIHAALQPGMQGGVDFILGVGAYYDLPQTLSYMTTGYFEDEGQLNYRQPNDYGKWVFVLSNLHRLDDPQQRDVLRQIAARRLASTVVGVDELIAQLRGEGLAIFQYIDNRDPLLSTALQQQLPRALREEISRLNLADKDFTALHAKVLLLHGREDTVIPYTQSIALAAALPEGQATLIVLKDWSHVEPLRGGMDLWQMFRALYALFSLRDGNTMCF